MLRQKKHTLSRKGTGKIQEKETQEGNLCCPSLIVVKN